MGAPVSGSRRSRAAARIDGVRTRALEVTPRAPGYDHAMAVVSRDRSYGGGLLAGALAFRLFGALLPFALLVSVVLGYAATVDRAALADGASEIGIGSALLDSVAESAKLSSGTRWSVALFAVFALLWAAHSAARAIRAVHGLAWHGAVTRFRRPLPAALMLVAVTLAFGTVIAATGWAREQLGSAGIGVTVVAFAAFFALWLGVSLLLPHRNAPWQALVPGAVVVALGVQVIHLGTVLFVAERIERASETYGSLGVSFTILVWLYVLSRVIVASAMLNASLWDRRGASAA